MGPCTDNLGKCICGALWKAIFANCIPIRFHWDASGGWGAQGRCNRSTGGAAVHSVQGREASAAAGAGCAAATAATATAR